MSSGFVKILSPLLLGQDYTTSDLDKASPDRTGAPSYRGGEFDEKLAFMRSIVKDRPFA